MFISRIVAAGFVLIVGALVTVFTLLSNPNEGATRLPVELDLEPVELAAEPFDRLASVYSEGEDVALAATRDLVSAELLILLETTEELTLGLSIETIKNLVTQEVEAAIGRDEIRAFEEELTRGIPTVEATELEAARLAANPAPKATSILTLSPEERRIIAFGNLIASRAVQILLNLQAVNGPFAQALEQSGQLEMITGISARPTRIPRVAVRTIEAKAFIPVRQTPASTAVQRRTDVRARTGSPVAEILVDRGDDVEVGQILMVLDTDDRPARRAQALASIAQGEAGILQAEANRVSAEAGVISAQAQVSQAETTLKDARDNFTDTQNLVEAGARGTNALRDAQVRVDQAVQSLSVAEAGLAQAEASLAQVEASAAQAEASLQSAQASLEQIDLDIERLTITAPFAGRIEDRFVELGSAVNPGEPVVRLAQMDTIKITAQVSDSVRNDLSLGQDIEVTIGESKEHLKGPITFIGATSGDNTRTFEIQMEIENARDADGKFVYVDNQFATAFFPAPERTVFRIPQSALTSATILDDGEGETGLRVIETQDGKDMVAFLPINQSDFGEGGYLLIEPARLNDAEILRLIVALGGFVDIGDRVFAREELNFESE